MSSQPPPDLRVLCRKLSSIPPAQLPHALPALSKHVARCRHALSGPQQQQQQQQQKARDDASQTSLLVHKLKTGISTLLTGRSPEARFAAIGLVKAAVDVGGWETLRGSEPWVRGLLSVVQKGDAAASKELAVVALTRIYVSVQPYQTLVREIATPTVPAFATACLQLIKPAGADRPPVAAAAAAPLALVETICDAFSTLIPLYPTTFRPFASQVRSAVRGYLAPTSCDAVVVPRSLQRAAGRLAASLHHVAAAKSGGDEWAKMVDGVIRELHATADQVLRAIDETWDSTGGYGRTAVDPGGEPSGGSASADKLPPWDGVGAGAERLTGLFRHLADYLRYPTRGPVSVPLGGIMGAISRVCLVAKLSSKTQAWDQALETNPAIGREERDELWSVVPDIHEAAMDLMLVMLRRLGRGMLPLVPELLDHLARVFRSGMDVPAIRTAGYLVLEGLLTVAGPTLSKPAVAMVEPLAAACCRDLQQDAGLLLPRPSSSKPAAPAPGARANGAAAANADLFLPPSAAAAAAVADESLDPDHRAAAARLLPALLSALPQRHLRPNLRGLLDRTAIVTRSRAAMLASVLHPYRDPRGRAYPSILPHLSRQHPHDQDLEVLRTHLRVGSALRGRGALAAAELEEDADEEEREAVEEDEGEETDDRDVDIGDGPGSPQPAAPAPAAAPPAQTSPFIPGVPVRAAPAAEVPSKRRHGDADPAPSKRQELTRPAANEEAEGEGDDSDESVHLNMELDDDEGSEEEGGGQGDAR